jgi:hypothetical protein
MFEFFVFWEAVNSGTMFGDGQNHLLKKLRIAVALRHTVPHHVAYAAGPQAKGPTILELAGYE